MIIDHDKDEPPRDTSGNTVYWVNAVFLTLLWAWFLFSDSEPSKWASVCLGVWSGMFIAIWAIDMTGNKTPKWMR